jgi:hypothetical protein
MAYAWAGCARASPTARTEADELEPMTARAAWSLCPGRHRSASPTHHFGGRYSQCRVQRLNPAKISPSPGQSGVLALWPYGHRPLVIRTTTPAAHRCVSLGQPSNLCASTGPPSVAAGRLGPRWGHVLDLGRAQSLRARCHAAVCRGVGCKKRGGPLHNRDRPSLRARTEREAKRMHLWAARKDVLCDALLTQRRHR